MQIELLRYQREDGREPFTEWLRTVRDPLAQARIRIRLSQVVVVGMETKAVMSKRKSDIKGTVSHHERELAELRANRDLAVQYLKAAMESLDDPNDRAGALLALRTVAEAYGGLSAVASAAGITREALYRALSAKGNPTLKTLLAVLKTVGLRLSVEPEREEQSADV